MSEIESLFIELVKIDSPSGYEEEMRKYLLKWLDEKGFQSKVDKVGNIYACSPKSKPALLLSAHMDTVEPGRSINPKIKDGLITSDGTTVLGADNKAAICAIITAVNKYVKTHKVLPPIEIIFSVKEETGGGIEFFPFEWIKSKEGVIFDYAKTLGSIVIQAPFIYNFKAIFSGKASHSSKPENGINSLIPAINFISQIKIGRSSDSTTTINIGRVVSGTGINSVPETTEVYGEVRSLNQNNFLNSLSEIKNYAYEAIKNTKIKLKYDQDGYCPGYKLNEHSTQIKQIETILKKELRNKITFDVATGVSDANSFNDANIQVITISDGVRHPHTKNECINTSDIVSLSNIVFSLLGSID